MNAGGHGFYRVAYGPQLRDRLTDPAVLSTLAPLERYCLVDDAWSATVAGRIEPADLLDFLAGFRDETEFGVWQAVVASLVGLSRIVDGDALDALRARVRSIVEPALQATAAGLASSLSNAVTTSAAKSAGVPPSSSGARRFARNRSTNAAFPRPNCADVPARTRRSTRSSWSAANC